ncbi:ATP-binding protein [Arenibacter sp. M-2]|uniref:ATP-binding protein n=1 Tax=Arenibacter sp. M-2 TaxID=3053612 RepID=UPI00256FF01A|nr:ATP-binding protein [Arenibacter sp. M-2]MDL5515014.1 ATP-binding protein [Arenibacter sp. M-2]
MKNVIGTPARGKDFFQRKREIYKIIKAIEEGANIQLAAPRRVGKTSILMHLLDNQPNDNHYLYLDTEAISDTNDFFKKIYSEVIKSNCVSGSVKVIQQIKGAGNSFLKKIKGINVSGAGLELSETEDLNYYNELINLLKGIQLDKGKIILMIDEFPYTISNIIDKTKSNDEAITFLQLNRSLRLDPNINLKIQFIYTGL